MHICVHNLAEVPKFRVSNQAAQFGDEIHTDVPPDSDEADGISLVVTFTNDDTRFTSPTPEDNESVDLLLTEASEEAWLVAV